MRRISDAARARAAAPSRTARARRGRWLAALRARTNFESPLGVTAIFILGLAISAALFHGHVFAFTLKLTGIFGLWQPSPDKFSDTAEIVFTPVDGNTCRKVLFFNRSGHFSPDVNVRCDTRLPAGEEAVVLRNPSPSERMFSIRAALTRAAR